MTKAVTASVSMVLPSNIRLGTSFSYNILRNKNTYRNAFIIFYYRLKLEEAFRDVSQFVHVHV